MLEKINKTIIKYNMINNGDKIVLGLSGGADSVCLFYLMNSLKNKLNLEIFVCHINHLLRGEDSDLDESFATQLCEKYGIPIFIKKINAKEYANDKKISLEEAGRQIRYSFFNEVKNEVKAFKIATAHNLNDQAETVLMRIINGASVEGIGGIKPVREDNIIRPLIEITKTEILNYLKENNLEYREDKSNLDTSFKRNKIRHFLLPELLNYNPSVLTNLSNTANLARQDCDFIKGFVNMAEEKYVGFKNDCAIIDLKIFKYEHRAVFQRIILNTIIKVTNQKVNVSNLHIEKICDLCINAKTGKGIDISSKLRAFIEYDNLIIAQKNEKIYYNYYLKVGSEIFIPQCNKFFKTYVTDIKNAPKYSKNTLVFDYKDSFEGINIRSRKNGDSYSPIGFCGTKKIKNILIDAKIPKNIRDIIPIISYNDDILWVYGFRISEKYKINENTKKVLVIEIKEGEVLW